MIKLAIDFGSQITKIYMLGAGVVLSEATCVAVEQTVSEEKTVYSVKSFGNKARALYGKAAKNTHIINPVFEGDIVNLKLATALMAHFFDKIEVSSRAAKNCEVIFVLPCGATEELKDKYLQIAEELNIGLVYFTQTPFAAVAGHNATITESTPVFSVDIGYGTTNIAVFSLDGIINGYSINLGGGNIDVHIMDYMAENHNVKIGALTAERIKNTVGSLVEDDYKITVADGRDIKKGTPESVAVNTEHIHGVIKLYIDKIIEYIKLVITQLPAEVSSSVMRGGLYLSGGLIKLDGLSDYISVSLNMPVNCPEEPQYASVIGAGSILSTPALLESLAEEEE